MDFCRERRGKVTVQVFLWRAIEAEVCVCSFLISELDGGGCWTTRSSRFTLGKETRYPLCRRLVGAQGRCDLGVGKIKSLANTGVRVSNLPALGESFCQVKELPTCLYSRFTYMYMYMYVYTYTHTHTHTVGSRFATVRSLTCICICMCIHTHTHTHTQ